MSKYGVLDREDMIAALEQVEELAQEAVMLRGIVDYTHGTGCHIRHAGCLGELVLEVLEDKLMKVAVKRVATILGEVTGA